MIKKTLAGAFAAVFLTGTLVFAQDSIQPPATPKSPRKIKAKTAPSSTEKLTIENESVKVIIGENAIIIQKPSGETKVIPTPPEGLEQLPKLKELEARKKPEKSGFVLGDSVFLEELPEVEKSYRSRNISGDRVGFGQTIRVEENEELGGDAVAVFGRVEVEGKVNGSVVAPFGSVYLGPRAEIEGDVVSGHLEKIAGAVVRGSQVTVGISNRGARVIKGHPLDLYEKGPFANPPVLFIVFFSIFGVLALLSILTWALVPQRVETVKAQMTESFFKTFAVGFLGEILFWPVFILLCVTIIGIPVALVMLLIALPLAILLGFTSFDLYLGERLKKSFNFAAQSPALVIVLSKLALFLPILLGAFMMSFDSATFGFGVFLFVSGLVVLWVVLTGFFGAVIRSRYGGRVKASSPPSPPPTPAPIITVEPSAPPAGA